ncbi:hypothetical protein N8250_01170 [Gammaproteobacteria bacterium]|nr:hypothetical protein [Gammaproteobacteria bacterium]
MVNRFFDHLDYNNYSGFGGSLEYYIFELANYCSLVLLIAICYKLKYININSFIVWFGIFFLPLVLNYFLISPLRFTDQFQYAGEVMSLKANGVSIPLIASQSFGVGGNILSDLNPVTLSVSLMGLAPIPNYMTITSLAFANKFFLFFSFLILKNFFKNENTLLLLFLIPSFLLYSSISVRETPIILLGIFFLLNMLRDNYFIAFLLIIPLFILKIQLFAFFILYFIGRLIFRAHTSLTAIIIFAGVILLTTFIFDEVILQIVNYYRIGFAAEDMNIGGGVSGYAAWSVYGDAEALTIESILELIFLAILGLPKMILMPLPNTWTNIFYPIQFIESIGLVALYSFIAIKNNLLRNQEFIFLTFILVLSLMLYSVLAFNEGTFVRYRFSLFLPFVFATYYLSTLHQADSLKHKIQ